MAFRIARPSAMFAATVAALVIIIAAIVSIVGILRPAARGRLVVAPRTLLIARRVPALAAFPTAARRFRVTFRIAAPAAFAVARIIPPSTRRLGMAFRIAEPTAVATTFVRSAAPGEPTILVAI